MTAQGWRGGTAESQARPLQLGQARTTLPNPRTGTRNWLGWVWGNKREEQGTNIRKLWSFLPLLPCCGLQGAQQSPRDFQVALTLEPPGRRVDPIGYFPPLWLLGLRAGFLFKQNKTATGSRGGNAWSSKPGRGDLCFEFSRSDCNKTLGAFFFLARAEYPDAGS